MLIHPGIDVGFLLRQHPAAFFLVEKNNRPRGKAFAARGGNGGLGIRLAQPGRVRNRFQLGVRVSR